MTQALKKVDRIHREQQTPRCAPKWGSIELDRTKDGVGEGVLWVSAGNVIFQS